MAYEPTNNEVPWAEFVTEYEEETAEILDDLNQVLYEADDALHYKDMMERAGYDPNNLTETARAAAISLVVDNFASTTADWRYRSAFD